MRSFAYSAFLALAFLVIVAAGTALLWAISGCAGTATVTPAPSVITITLPHCGYYQPIDPDGSMVLATNVGPDCNGRTMGNLLEQYTPDSDVPWISTGILSGGTQVIALLSPDGHNVLHIYAIGSKQAVSAAAGLAEVFVTKGWLPEVFRSPSPQGS
jgi:hypothetical protein